MSKLEFLLLGRFECLLSTDRRISLPMRKAEVLLAFLALAPAIRHPRERLINLLWSDRSDEQARNSLRQALSSIRKSLGEIADLVLQIDRTTVSLNAEMIEVDALEFERLATQGDYEALTSAADLYQGEFLEGMSIRDAACQEWLDSERQRFKRQFIEILFNLAETQLLSHDYGHAIRSAERLVEQDPLVESAWRLLMRGYFERGDRGHALQAFKRCRQVLRDELEVDPERATVELREQIAGGEIESRPAPAAQKNAASQATSDSAHSIAVLPFDNLSGDPEQEYFSDGITDSIILHLSLFPGLHVKSRNSSFAFKQQIKSLGEISRELNVDYIVEGSIRRSDERIRITVQLIEAASGNQVWGKRYDSDIEDLLNLEEELSRTIAATVTGQIESDLQRIAIRKGAADLGAYDLLLSGAYHLRYGDRNSVLMALEEFNQCLSRDPDNARAHANLFYCHDVSVMDHWTEDGARSRELATQHILEAVALDPDSACIQVAYANHLIFVNRFDEAERQLKRALDSNPNDTQAIAMRALCLSTRGEPEAGLEQAELALQLDPYHPWARWIRSECLYFCDRFEDCLANIDDIDNPPGFIQIYRVAANVRLGRLGDARRALDDLMQFCRDNMPSVPESIEAWRDYYRDNAPFADPAKNDHIIECLVQAGLEDTLSRSVSPIDSSDMPSIAVLPFGNLSGDPEQEYFSDGITASVILSLGLFKGLQVKSQNSSFAFKSSNLSSQQIAQTLDADYLVEGSIRKSGARIRLSVQLIEAASGNQLWGHQYDEKLEDIFDLEQELSRSLASTISGRLGHQIQQSAVRKPAKDLKSYDYLMRGLYHIGKFTVEDMKEARAQIRKCLAIDPENSYAYTSLATTYGMDRLEGWSDDLERVLKLERECFDKALNIDPDNAQAHAFFAEHLHYLGRYEQAEYHADRAIELNPTMVEGYAAKADLLNFARRADEALKYADICLQLDPYAVATNWVAGDAYRVTGQFEKAIRIYRSIAHAPPTIHAMVAVCFLGMGLLDEAHAEMQRYLEMTRQQMSRFPRSIDEWREHWLKNSYHAHPEDAEKFFDQLLQAGLCDDSADKEEKMPSIAVLPFENLSGDPEQEYFSEGITTDIVETLSKFRHIRTISRYSTAMYRAEKPPIADIAEQQGVRYILEGSVRKSGERIRVSAELIDAHSGQICWSDRFDRELDDLFAVQDEITRSIALAMKVQLDDGDQARLRSRGTDNIKAWERVMVAVDLQDTYIRQNILDARALANEAIELDPDYPYAWLSLGWTHWQEAYSGWSRSIDESIAEAARANDRARDLDPDYAEVWSQAGTIQIMNQDAEAAIELCRKAVELEPGSAEIQALLAFAHVFAGDYEHALKINQNVVRLCPVRANWYFLIEGQVEVAFGNFERAADIYRQGLAVEAESPLCRFFLVDLMMQIGNETAARQYADEIRALDKSVTARGLVRTYSSDPSVRDAFHSRLERFGLV